MIHDIHQLSELTFPLPCIVKPLHEGSSKGIFNASVVYTEEELDRQIKRVIVEYKEPALVEQFLTGREFTVAVLGNGPIFRYYLL